MSFLHVKSWAVSAAQPRREGSEASLSSSVWWLGSGLLGLVCASISIVGHHILRGYSVFERWNPPNYYSALIQVAELKRLHEAGDVSIPWLLLGAPLFETSVAYLAPAVVITKLQLPRPLNNTLLLLIATLVGFFGHGVNSGSILKAINFTLLAFLWIYSERRFSTRKTYVLVVVAHVTWNVAGILAWLIS